jgi:hypothetical protein
MENQENEKQKKLGSQKPSRIERQEIEQQLKLQLLQGPEEKIKERGRDRALDRRNEIIQLHGGGIVTFEQYVANSFQEHDPMFPNSNDFFAEMFRLAGWKHLNPDEYIKPPEAKYWLVETIYYRFHKEAVPKLKSRIRYRGNHKLYHLLNDEGIAKLIQFRDDAVEMMRTFNDGQIDEFRLAYAQKYATAFQLPLIKR